MRTEKKKSGISYSFNQVRLPPELPEERFAIHAVGLTTPKRLGEVAEAAFLAKAASFGFGVAKPWGDSERYDFILDSGHHLWRVQLKSTGRYAESRYQVKAGGSNATYTRDEIDFLVAYLIPENLWYVVPIEAFPPAKTLRFYPHSGGNPQLEKYREAWCQMACPRNEKSASQILVARRCEKASVACSGCPLVRLIRRVRVARTLSTICNDHVGTAALGCPVERSSTAGAPCLAAFARHGTTPRYYSQ